MTIHEKNKPNDIISLKMTLKNRILVDKFLFLTILLVALIIIAFKDGINMFLEVYGFYFFLFAIWLIGSIIYFYNTKNHLIKYSIEEGIIKFTFYKNLYDIQEATIPLTSIKSTDFHTRMFNFSFDILKIKYVDRDELYDVLELRISEKKDWVAILSKIEMSQKTN